MVAECLGDRLEPPRLLAAVGVAVDRTLVVSGPRVDVQLVALAIVAVGRGHVRSLIPSFLATTWALAWPWGSKGAIAFSTVVRNGPVLPLRAFRFSSHVLSRILFKRRSAFTSANSAEPTGKSISSTSLPNSISFPRTRANFEIPSERTCIKDTRLGKSCRPQSSRDTRTIATMQNSICCRSAWRGMPE